MVRQLQDAKVDLRFGTEDAKKELDDFEKELDRLNRDREKNQESGKRQEEGERRALAKKRAKPTTRFGESASKIATAAATAAVVVTAAAFTAEFILPTLKEAVKAVLEEQEGGVLVDAAKSVIENLVDPLVDGLADKVAQISSALQSIIPAGIQAIETTKAQVLLGGGTVQGGLALFGQFREIEEKKLLLQRFRDRTIKTRLGSNSIQAVTESMRKAIHK